MPQNANRLLVVIVALQALILLGQWTGSALPVAAAQVPDAGAQRNETIRELQQLNAKLERVATLMESGKLAVTPIRPAPQADAPGVRK